METPGYILRATSHEEHTTLPFEDALGLSRELALALDDKVAIFRASDDKPNPKRRRRRR